jgi:predicted PurR-regulated permease PerM
METQDPGPPNAARTAVGPVPLYLAILSILTAIAYVGRPILLPLAIAVVVWFIIKAFAHAIHAQSLGGLRLPSWLSYGLAMVLILMGLVYFTGIISTNITRIAAAAPAYEANLDQLILSASEHFGLGDLPDIRQLLVTIDISRAIKRAALSLGDLLGSAGLILIYVAFLLVEQRVFHLKFNAFYSDPARRRDARRVLDTITAQIEVYLRIKTLTSLLTGGVSFAVLWWFDVDFAGFWAIIIFLLNYIPTIGSLLGVVFPAIIALVQFDTLGPFLAVTLCLTATQIVIGNVVEPALMGRTLNMSPLVIILSLSFWGTLWGVAGMFLAVPLTMIAIIICSHVPRTRPIAILLSSDGRIDRGEPEKPPSTDTGPGTA